MHQIEYGREVYIILQFGIYIRMFYIRLTR